MSREHRSAAPYHNPRQAGQSGWVRHQYSRDAGPSQQLDRHHVPAHHLQHRVVNNGARNECTICSFTQQSPDTVAPVYHRHFSSLRLRELTGAVSNTNPFLCPSCKSSHVPYPGERVKIVVSDSTLHEFFSASPPPGVKQYKGDKIHVDYITIPGADINTLRNAFRLDYVDKFLGMPLDVCLVAGYNDLVKGYSREQIRYDLREFSTMVIEAQSGLDVNTFAVSTLMYPPQLAWFPDNGEFPYPGYVNQKEKIDWINQEIHVLNEANQVPLYAGFHTYGVRKDTKKRVDRYGQLHQRTLKYHRWEHWREADRGYMLHLKNERRFKMGMALVNYFIHNT